MRREEAATAYRDRVRNPAGTGGAPIAYWRLAEIAEAPAVDTQELQDGVYHGPIEYLVPGIADGSDRNDAIAGDGRSAWLEVPHVAGLALAEYTLSFCFQADRLPPRGENAVLLSKDTHPSPEGGLSIELITSATTGQTRLRIYIAVAGTAVWLGGTAGKREGLGAEILAEVAHHVAVVLNGSGIKLYLDGAEIGADPAQMTGWTANARRISVLAWDGSDGWFDGIFDELVIYDHGLTESEIADLARPRTAPNPGIHAEPGVQIFDAAYATEWRFTVEVGAPGKDRRVYVALAWNSETIGSAPESCNLDGVAGRLVTPEAAQQWNRAAAVEWLEADLPARAGTCTVTITLPASDRALGRAYPLSYIGHEQIAAMAQGSNAANATAIHATVTCPKSSAPIVGVLSLGAANRPSPVSGQSVLHSDLDAAQSNLWAFDRSLPEMGESTRRWTFSSTNRAAYHLGVLPTNRAGDPSSASRPSGEVTLATAARSPSARPPADASIWVPGGTETDPAASTEANPMGSLIAALNGARAGDVIAVKAGDRAWDYTESGTISGKNGAPGRPIKVIGYGARRVIIDGSIKKFRGGSQASPLSVWTQVNSSLQIWEEVSASSVSRAYGYMDPLDVDPRMVAGQHSLKLLTYKVASDEDGANGIAAFESTSSTSTGTYAGPGLRVYGSKIRVRMAQPIYTAEIYGGNRPLRSNPNHNDLAIFETGTTGITFSDCSWIEWHYIDVLYFFTTFNTTRSHHILFEDTLTRAGRFDYSMNRSDHDIIWSHCTLDYGLPHWWPTTTSRRTEPQRSSRPTSASTSIKAQAPPKTSSCWTA